MLLSIMKVPMCFDRFLTEPVMNPREITHLEHRKLSEYFTDYMLNFNEQLHLIHCHSSKNSLARQEDHFE